MRHATATSTRTKRSLDNLPRILVAPRTDAIYNCHGYLTKVPIAAIEPFIEAFTESGETVVDSFAGSGMTGLAAVRLGRRARMSDISVLGRHIATGYLVEVDHSKLSQASEAVVLKARKRLGDLYTTVRAEDGQISEMVRTIWSFTYRCPTCNGDFVYFDHLLPGGKCPSKCPHCAEAFVRRSSERGPDVPVQVVVRGRNGRLVEQPITDYDRALIRTATEDPRQSMIPSLEITPDREMYSRSGLGKAGLAHTRDFFSPRNAVALLELWNAISQVTDTALRQKLRFAFTAMLPRASRRYQWSPKRPLNAQNQTYYIAPVYYEWNVFELFSRKIEAAIRADEEFGASVKEIGATDFLYQNSSADDLSYLADESADYVFIDPPFGSNIFYSDMSLFHEAWLGDVTQSASEAVVHTTGRRKNGAQTRYEKLLGGALKEAFRVLKPGRFLSIVFGNSNGQIWGLVQRAIRTAGFYAAPVHVCVLDKGQRSVKGLNSGVEGVVTVDLVVTLCKPTRKDRRSTPRELCQGDARALIRDAIAEVSGADKCTPSHVYAKVLEAAIRNHQFLDKLHLSDVLLELRDAGFSIDPKTGLLNE